MRGQEVKGAKGVNGNKVFLALNQSIKKKKKKN